MLQQKKTANSTSSLHTYRTSADHYTRVADLNALWSQLDHSWAAQVTSSTAPGSYASQAGRRHPSRRRRGSWLILCRNLDGTATRGWCVHGKRGPMPIWQFAQRQWLHGTHDAPTARGGQIDVDGKTITKEFISRSVHFEWFVFIYFSCHGLTLLRLFDWVVLASFPLSTDTRCTERYYRGRKRYAYKAVTTLFITY
jgi:hypothetical protein